MINIEINPQLTFASDELRPQEGGVPVMVAPTSPASEDVLARLTAAAYHVALRHGLRSPFIDVELDLWRELRRVLAGPPARAAAAADRLSPD
jgi:hypothetical protein